MTDDMISEQGKVYNHLDKANQMTNITTEKCQKKKKKRKKNLCRKLENNKGDAWSLGATCLRASDLQATYPSE